MSRRKELARLSTRITIAKSVVKIWSDQTKQIYETKKNDPTSCPSSFREGDLKTDLDQENLPELVQGYIDHSLQQIIQIQNWSGANLLKLELLIDKYLPRAIDEVGEWEQLIRLELNGACKEIYRVATEFILKRSSELVYTLLKFMAVYSLFSKKKRSDVTLQKSTRDFVKDLLTLTQKITIMNRWLEALQLHRNKRKAEEEKLNAIVGAISMNPNSAAGEEVPVLNQRLTDLQVVGSGGFGTVYRGKPIAGTETETMLPEGDTFLAVKKIVPMKAKHRQSIVEEIGGLFSFQCPARRAAIINAKLSQHVKPYCAFFKALDAWSEVMDGKYTAFILMPYFEGGLTGRTLLKSPASSSFRLLSFKTIEALDWLRWVTVSLGQAIARIHSKFMVHRDLKPENFLFKESEQKLYLADYGLLCDEKEDDNASSRYCSYGGTPSFMDPLVQYASVKANALSDSYSFGSSLYEFLLFILEKRYEHWYLGDKELSDAEHIMKLQAKHRVFQNEVVPQWKKMVQKSYPEIEVLIEGVSLMLEPREREMRPTVKSFANAVAKGKLELLMEK